ncbi:MAG: hypothetical protein GXP03_00555 [Alphaproteobacteria bacterium]|nr:hypothetical protein [Alphaproteobacteria bacterium]
MDEIETTAETVEAAALPDAKVAHCDPDMHKTPEEMPLPPEIGNTPLEDKSEAQWAYERLVLYIQNFEKTLDGDHEIGMGFAGGEMGVMRIQGIGFFAPDILTFYGTDMTGAKTQLVQHVGQLNVMLRAAPKESQTKEANRIGFRLAAAFENPASSKG